MSVDGSGSGDWRRREVEPSIGEINGNGVVVAPVRSGQQQRLRLNPNTEHKPDKYDDMRMEFSPLLFSSLERFLPSAMLGFPREAKARYMREILKKYLPDGERMRAQKHKEYKQRIISSYQPLHRELHVLHATNFLVPSFLDAITANTEESFRSIISEPAPGIFTFEMLRPHFCNLLLAEVENFEKWVFENKIRIMQPNTMNKYGVVLDDFGLETMLGKLMDDYIRPLSKVFFPEVGGSTLDSHHGFVVEYGIDRDTDLGFHVDDAEVTLNVCLGKRFSGGELFFRGVRCDKHVNSETHPEYLILIEDYICRKFLCEEILDYCHVPGRAVLHGGRHRHGARATTDGNRINLILWCRSSVFRELKKHQRDCSRWCGECLREKKERQELSVSAIKQELLKRNGELTSTVLF